MGCSAVLAIAPLGPLGLFVAVVTWVVHNQSPTQLASVKPTDGRYQREFELDSCKWNTRIRSDDQRPDSARLGYHDEEGFVLGSHQNITTSGSRRRPANQWIPQLGLWPITWL